MENNERKLTYGRTSVYNLNYHIVWGTKYRNKCLCYEIDYALKSILHGIAREKGFTISHVEIGESDHVHLLVSAPPKMSVTNIVKCLKAESSLKLFKFFPKQLGEFYRKTEGERNLWSHSYFVESIGASNQDAVAKYIDDQRKKEESRK